LTNGTIYTIAGNGTQGSGKENDVSTRTTVNTVYGVAFSSEGDVFVADSVLNHIRKIFNNNTISLVAGNGASAWFGGDGDLALKSLLKNPFGIAINSTGDIFIADNANYRVRKVFNNESMITTILGTGEMLTNAQEMPAIFAQTTPYGLAISSTTGELFISDFTYIRKISQNGNVSVLLDTVGGANGIALTESNQVIYAESTNNMVKSLNGKQSVLVAGIGTAGYSGDGGLAQNAMLDKPYSVVYRNGLIYFTEVNNHCVRKIDSYGIITTIAGNGTAGFSGDGGSATNAMLNKPLGLAMSVQGEIFICDSNNHRIRKISTNGTITTIAGDGTANYNGDYALANVLELNFPVGIAIAPSGEIIFSDMNNQRVRKLYPVNITLPYNNSVVSNSSVTNSSSCELGLLEASFSRSVSFVNSTVKVAITVKDACFESIRNDTTFEFKEIGAPSSYVSSSNMEKQVVFDTIGNYTYQVLVYVKSVLKARVNTTALNVVSYDNFFSDNILSTFSLNELSLIATSSETYQSGNVVSSTLKLTTALVNSYKNMSDVSSTLTVVNAFKTISSKTSYLMDSTIQLLSSSANNISTSLALSNISVNSFKTVDSIVDGLVNVYSNCYSVDNQTLENVNTFLKNVIITASKTSHETDKMFSVSSGQFKIDVIRNMNSMSNSVGNFTLSTPSEMKGTSMSVITFLNAAKLFSNSTGGITVSDSFNNLRFNTNAVQVMELNYMSNGMIMTVENLQNTIDIQFIMNQSVVSFISSNSKYSLKCMYYNESTLSWKSDGCTTEVVGSKVTCHCTHTTKFSSFIDFTETSDKGLMIANIVISSIFVVLITIVLILLVLSRNKSPTKSRWILPYFALISLLIEMMFSDIISNVIGISGKISSASVVKEVATMINATLFVIAISNYFLLNLRYIVFRYMYELLALVKDKPIGNKLKILKTISRRFVLMVVDCVLAGFIIAYFVIFICLRQTEVITSDEYAKIMTSSVFSMVMIFTIGVATLLIVDIGLEWNYSQFSTLLKDFKKSKQEKQRVVNNIVGNLFITNDKLCFRREMIIYFLAMLSFIVSYALGFSTFGATNTTNVLVLNGVGLAFGTIFNVLLIITFGGFVTVISLIQSKHTSEPVSEIERIIHNPSLCELFEQFSKLEFSIENIIMLKKVNQALESIANNTISPNELTIELQNWQADHFESNSPMEVNLPADTRNCLLQLVKSAKLDLKNASTILQDLKQDVLMNVNDTFSRFMDSVGYQQVSDMIELKDSVGKDFN